MGVAIDESRRHYQAIGIDFFAPGSFDGAQSNYAIPYDGNVTSNAGGA
jgi:hypothetical protein